MSRDPGRDLIMEAAARGLVTVELAKELDEWAGGLATEKLEGKLTEAEVEAKIIERLRRDLGRRGQS